MSEKPTDTVVRAWARLMMAQNLALASVERDLKAAGMPPLAWYDVLLEVERAADKGLRPFELERAMLLAQYNLSRLIDRIAQAGYVVREACEDDGRGQVVKITAEGKSLRRKMWPVYARAIEAAMGRNLSQPQAKALDDLLGQLVERQKAAIAR